MSQQPIFKKITLDISPERIYWLKFLLEGYEGLAGQSTVDRKTGRVEIYCSPDRQSELDEFLLLNGPSFGLSHVNAEKT